MECRLVYRENTISSSYKKCPDCGSNMIPQGGCGVCMSCGFSTCG